MIPNTNALNKASWTSPLGSSQPKYVRPNANSATNSSIAMKAMTNTPYPGATRAHAVRIIAATRKGSVNRPFTPSPFFPRIARP
jgi:hypothetical protein